ncbi:MAG: transglycosylase SLT domain-containing protein [Gemmatimonadaceae bacterium]|nr:transglycosylase SLT domain-containing protein [Gemmatimonadaceae bacterium]
MAEASSAVSAPAFPFGIADARRMHAELDATKGQLALAQSALDRANAVIEYSTKYKVSADLAGAIYDGAMSEGIEPDLGFRLVRVESEFKDHATSPVGALGLTQVMPATAKDFVPGITHEQLYDRKTNLMIGFRYLRGLISQYKGDVKLALLVYNRGPVAVESLRALGLDPRNGYEAAVTRGYNGKGTVD